LPNCHRRFKIRLVGPTDSSGKTRIIPVFVSSLCILDAQSTPSGSAPAEGPVALVRRRDVVMGDEGARVTARKVWWASCGSFTTPLRSA